MFPNPDNNSEYIYVLYHDPYKSPTEMFFLAFYISALILGSSIHLHHDSFEIVFPRASLHTE